MSDVEMSLPDRIDSEIDRLVEQGDFLNPEQAVEELLTMGVSAYAPTEEAEEFFDRLLAVQEVPLLDESVDFAVDAVRQRHFHVWHTRPFDPVVLNPVLESRGIVQIRIAESRKPSARSTAARGPCAALRAANSRR